MENHKYLFITKNWPPAICGIGDYTNFVATELKKLGMEVHVITSVGADPDKSQVQVHPMIESFSVLEALKILRKIEEIEPKAVNFQYLPQITDKYGILPGAVFLSLLVRLFCQSKFITTFHEMFIPLSKKPHLFLIALLQRVYFFLIALFTGIIIVTTKQRKEYVEKCCFAKKVHLVPVGSNIPVINFKEEDIKSFRKSLSPEGGYVLCSFGMASRSKNYNSIIEIAYELSKLGLSLKLLLIGDIERDDKVLNSIKGMIKELKLEEKVVLTGKLSPYEISKFIGSSDFFIINQKNGVSTGSGTLMAAFGHGTPVIANKCEHTDEIFSDRDNIYFIDMSRPRDCAPKVMSILNDADLALKIRKGALDTFNKSFSWESIAQRILDTGA